MEKNTAIREIEWEVEEKMERDLIALTISPSTTPSQSLLRREFRDDRLIAELEQNENVEENLEYTKELSQAVGEALNCKKEDCTNEEVEDKETCSPTTSTPGNSPISSQGTIKSSELHDSEESIIEPATPVCRMKTTPKIIGRKIEMTPYMNNSVDTNVTQDTTDADWETSQDITEITVINGEIRSSIAQRTRSKTEQIRETNLSVLKGNYNKTMEKSFEVFNDKENDYTDTKYSEYKIKNEEQNKTRHVFRHQLFAGRCMGYTKRTDN